MTDPRQLEFVTRHFTDLQTIRFAPIPLAMMLALAVPETAHFGRAEAWIIVLGFPIVAVGFYAWSTAAIKRRFGSVRTSRKIDERMQFHPVMFVLHLGFVAVLAWAFLFSRGSYSDIYIAMTVLTFMLTKVLDATNLPSRRIAWALGLGMLAAVFPFRSHLDSGALAGAVWLSLSIYDFLLLRRVFTPSVQHA